MKLDWLKKFLLPDPVSHAEGYRIWSKAHDQVVDAKELLKQHHRQPPDEPSLLSPREVLHAYEAATVDLRGSLATEIQMASESIARHWMAHPAPPIVLTLLMDHSGSLRGEPVELLYTVAQCFATLCETLGIKNEILAFTTVNWHGKPVRSEWIKQGSMMSPGRLCALRHIVYRSFKAAHKKVDLSAMFIPGLLKENIDGEAILWASERMAGYDDCRRLLIVVSDGAPVDDSTLQKNAPDILWKHLHEVIGQFRASGQVELYGVGIRYSIERLYQRSCYVVELTDVEQSFLPFLTATLTETSVS